MHVCVCVFATQPEMLANQERHVEIMRGETGFGLSLVTAEGVPAVVLGVVPNSPAASSGDVQMGEIIEEVSG